MSAWSLIHRSLRYFWRTHLGVVLGAACATAVLVGALCVGDSVRSSLREHALNRIGAVDAAVVVRERFFRSNLADLMESDLSGVTVASGLQLQGMASEAGSSERAAFVDVFGVDRRFFALSPDGDREPPAPGQALVNERLAGQLGVGPGDTILLRIEKPSHLPREMLMATIDDISFALRLEVGAVLSEGEFGRFSLRASQIPPFDVFILLPWLQEQLDLIGRSNLLLLNSERGSDDIVERANEVLRRSWRLADAELWIQQLEGTGLFELTSDRVFIEDPIVDFVTQIDPDLFGVLTYLVNGIRVGDRTTPYSMVSAVGALAATAAPDDPAVTDALAVLPGELAQDEIVFNQWLVEDLQAEVGDTVELDYYVMGPELRLGEETRVFRVRSVVPMNGLAADPGLMPEFPGITGAENSRDWEPGIPIDLGRIRDVDEEYWDDHRGTPKAFVELRAGQGLWGNRFGSLTAIRGPGASADSIEEQILRGFDPAGVGLFFQDIRGPALAGGTSATDFGGLFLGLSFFLIAASLLLTSLLFVFGVEQRANEIGTLLAVGFPPKRVRRLYLAEALVLATIGGVVGAFLGVAYTHGVLSGLGSLWRDAVGSTTLTFHALPGTIALGVVVSVATALLAIAFALRKAFTLPAVELLGSRNGIPLAPSKARSGRPSRILAVGAPVLAIAMLIVAGTSSGQASGAFFGAGALLLIGGLAACRIALTRFAGTSNSEIASVSALGVRNTGRRPGRSLATIALLASGTFLVVAIQANRLEPPRDFAERGSGTGGFALFGRSTLPVLRDLGTETGRDAYGLEAEDLAGADIVALRVRDGDDASCLNLSLAQNPRLIGVRPAALAVRESFSFSSVLDPDGGPLIENPWLALDADYGEDVVPCIGDQASITWALHKSLGDTLDYVDEHGQPFRVRIVGAVANSILQGNLVISEDHFEARFPSVAGHRMFLIDAPTDGMEAIAANLTRSLEDLGLEVTSTTVRLEAFNAVQNTYLLIFQVLGGLGLLLGSVGLGMVVLRNALERRSELAIASAVGFSPSSIRKLVWSEHGLLLGLGLASGVLAALVAVLPGAGLGGLSMDVALFVLAVALSGAVWVWLATLAATRGPLLDALQND